MGVGDYGWSSVACGIIFAIIVKGGKMSLVNALSSRKRKRRIWNKFLIVKEYNVFTQLNVLGIVSARGSNLRETISFEEISSSDYFSDKIFKAAIFFPFFTRKQFVSTANNE